MAGEVRYLDGTRLQRCLSAGLQQLIGQRDYLNRINVFPVPDGDTGNNLANTAAAGLATLDSDADASVGTVLSRLAAAALDASQGNSGALLAQFLQGLAEGVDDTHRLTTEDFARAMTHAAAASRRALDAPREGTIITVIDVAAAAARMHAESDDFAILLPAMNTACLAALSATTAQLDVLRKAGVVDAGAAGFCAVLDGCTAYLLYGSIRSGLMVPPSPAEFSNTANHSLDDVRFRYCTECMLGGSDLDSAAVRNALHALGDSVVVAGSRQRLRIHIHTDRPEQVFREVVRFGHVQGTKADDMQGQARSLERRDRRVAIVTDTAADLPAEVIAALDVHVVPLRITFGNNNFLDKIGMGPLEFAAELERNPEQPGTSQPTQGDLRRQYEFLLTHFDEVVAIHLSSRLSGTYQAACLAAAALKDSGRIQIVDSANASVGQGLIVKRVGEFAHAGLHGPSLMAAVQSEIGAVKTFALVTDLSNAVRSGRLNPAVKRIADWLRLTPVLASAGSGTISVHGFIPGRRKLIERFAEYIVRVTGVTGRWEIGIAAGAARTEDAHILQTELSRRMAATDNFWQTTIGPALGIHTGMTAIVVALRKLQ